MKKLNFILVMMCIVFTITSLPLLNKNSVSVTESYSVSCILEPEQ